MIEYIYENTDVGANLLMTWWGENVAGSEYGIEGTSCAVGHFKKEEDGSWIPLPQCRDFDIIFPDGHKEEIFEGDTIVWNDGFLELKRTGTGINPRSYRGSLRINDQA